MRPIPWGFDSGYDSRVARYLKQPDHLEIEPMLYAITLNYIRPVDEIESHLDTHRDWLIEHTRQGRILVAGPLEPRTGGFVLATCENRAELDAMLENDSFYVHKLVDYTVVAATPALRAGDFPAQWAPDAKAV